MVISVAFLVVRTRGQGTTGIWWAESRDAAKHPTMHRTALCNNYPGQNSTVLRLRNPGLGKRG